MRRRLPSHDSFAFSLPGSISQNYFQLLVTAWQRLFSRPCRKRQLLSDLTNDVSALGRCPADAHSFFRKSDEFISKTDERRAVWLP